MLLRGLGVFLLLVTGVAHATATPITVFLDRHGMVTEDGVEIPPFGGGDRTWKAVVACVREQYAPFSLTIVQDRPVRGHFITAVVGGQASLLGLDDSVTNGVGPYDGTVLRDAVVHVFSQVGSGEHDVENLCAVTAHEVGHALGLDHERYCGDIMSYDGDDCGPRKFLDVGASCGEDDARACGGGEHAQNSFRRLGELIGFRSQPPAPPDEAADADLRGHRPPPPGDRAGGTRRLRDPWGDVPPPDEGGFDGDAQPPYPDLAPEESYDGAWPEDRDGDVAPGSESRGRAHRHAVALPPPRSHHRVAQPRHSRAR